MTTVIAVDPGAGGGIAWITANGEITAEKYEGKTEADIALLLGELSDDSFTYLEKVGPNRGKGDRRQGASSMFSFGENFGFWRGLLTAYRMPFELVAPQKWLPAMGLRGIKEESQTDKKNRHKTMAQRMFPQLLITHKTADAILLAEFGRRQQFAEHGELQTPKGFDHVA